MSASAAGVFSFPLLKPREIFACLREMQVPVLEEEIRACDAGAVRKVLEAFIESAMGVTREEMAQIAFPGLPALSLPELHAEAIPELNFYRTAQRMLAACGVDDFGLKDVLQPTPKRVRRQLSALINFAKFREERLAAFSEITGQTDELLSHKKTLQDGNAALQRELDQLLEEQTAVEPERLQLQADVDVLAKEINEFNNQHAIVHPAMLALRAKRDRMDDALSTVRFNKVEAEDEIVRLQGLIVASPDRVKGELKAIAEKLEKEKDELHALEEKHAAVIGFIEVYERAEKELAKTFELLAEVDRELKACRDVKLQVKQAQTRIKEAKIRTAETMTRRQRLEKVVELKRRELERFIADARVKEQAATNALQSAREELDKLEAVHFEVRQRITQNTETGRAIELEMQELEAQYLRDIKGLEQMYTRLQHAAESYNSQILEAIQSSA